MTPKEQWKLAFQCGRLIAASFHDPDFKRCGELAPAVKYARTADDPLRLRQPMGFWLRQKNKRNPVPYPTQLNCRCVVRPQLFKGFD